MSEATNLEVFVPESIAYVASLDPQEFKNRLEKADHDVVQFRDIMSDAKRKYEGFLEENSTSFNQYNGHAKSRVFLSGQIAEVKQRLTKSKRNNKKAKLQSQLEQLESKLAANETALAKLKTKMDVQVDASEKWDNANGSKEAQAGAIGVVVTKTEGAESGEA